MKTDRKRGRCQEKKERREGSQRGRTGKNMRKIAGGGSESGCSGEFRNSRASCRTVQFRGVVGGSISARRRSGLSGRHRRATRRPAAEALFRHTTLGIARRPPDRRDRANVDGGTERNRATRSERPRAAGRMQRLAASCSLRIWNEPRSSGSLGRGELIRSTYRRNRERRKLLDAERALRDARDLGGGEFHIANCSAERRFVTSRGSSGPSRALPRHR